MTPDDRLAGAGSPGAAESTPSLGAPDSPLGPGAGGVTGPPEGPFGSGEIGGLMPGVDDRPAVAGCAHDPIERALHNAVEEARGVEPGTVSTYTPRLAAASPDLVSAAIMCPDGACHQAGDWQTHRFTLQSASKVILLIGLLEELGVETVFENVGTEPSGDRYDSLLQMTLHWPRPANPLINAGAITLCGLLEGGSEERRAWIEGWATRLCGEAPALDEAGVEHELRGNHINLAIAHLLKTSEVLQGDIDVALRAYYALCNLETDVYGAAHLAGVLAQGGLAGDGSRVTSARTAEIVVSLMATCGMYNESGAHLMSVGIAAKSGVSGLLLAVAPGRGGIATSSPGLGPLGTSLRGQFVLRRLSETLRWHFAHPAA